MRTFFLTALLMVFSSSVLAGSGSGKIIGIIPYSSGSEEYLFIKVENTSPDSPSCNQTQRFVMSSVNNPKFKATQSVALAAMMAGTRVVVKGNGTCDAYDNSETFIYMCVGEIAC